MDMNFLIPAEDADSPRGEASTTVIYPAVKVGGARVVQHTATAPHISEIPTLESNLLEVSRTNLVPTEELQRIEKAQKLEQEAQRSAHQKKEWEASHIKWNTRADHAKRVNLNQPGNRGMNY
jgi:hypothetical protein